MPHPILLTGAAGKTGRAILRALVDRGQPVRAFVRRGEQAQAVREAGAADVVVGDLQDAGAVARAMRSVTAVYHVCPNVSPDEVTIGQAVITAARTVGVERFVYHSVLHPQVEAMPHHWLKLRVEELLFASGLPFTILQPCAYMQNILANWGQIVETGVYPVHYRVEARLSIVDLDDVAKAAAIVLTEPGHAGAIYELAGPEPLSQVEVAALLARQIGRPVRAEVTSLDAWERRARAGGMGEYAVATLLAMFRYYDRHGLVGNGRVLGWLLGRPPTTFAEFLAATFGREIELTPVQAAV